MKQENFLEKLADDLIKKEKKKAANSFEVFINELYEKYPKSKIEMSIYSHSMGHMVVTEERKPGSKFKSIGKSSILIDFKSGAFSARVTIGINGLKKNDKMTWTSSSKEEIRFYVSS